MADFISLYYANHIVSNCINNDITKIYGILSFLFDQQASSSPYMMEITYNS